MNSKLLSLHRHHFVGIGGSGMMPLALLLAAEGISVSGSDRWFDKNPGDRRIEVLERAGAAIFPQSGGQSKGAVVVVSTAIEPSNPDLVGAVEVLHRSEVLVCLIKRDLNRQAIFVAGSSGKTTTTAMIGWILYKCGLDPFVYVGAGVEELAPHGARSGRGAVVVEVDESDGSIERFTPSIAVVTSVSEDHKPLAEVRRMFQEFSAKATHTVFSEQAADLVDEDQRRGPADELAHETIACAGAKKTNLLGSFNRINESLALSVAALVGIEQERAEKALSSFPGVARRLEIVASLNGRNVIDDFAHNPEKITASLDALRELDLPMMILFQPHGYGPTRMHHSAWGAAFSALAPHDRLVLLPIFDAGGTAERNVSSDDILKTFTGTGNGTVMTREEATLAACRFLAEPGVVVVMGARDPSLSDLARGIATFII